MRAELRVISNIKGLARAGSADRPVRLVPCENDPGIGRLLALFLRSFRCDYVLLNSLPRATFVLAALRCLVPFNPCRLLALDLVLAQPRSRVGRWKTAIRSFLLRRVHRIILYYPDTSEIRKHFRLPESKFDWVPFKVNSLDEIAATTIVDGGYVFCGGQTRRDFTTLAAAAAPLSIPVKIVTAQNAAMAHHGSYLDEARMPPNVEVVRLNLEVQPFIDLMAGCRIVVLPLKPDITGTGISVYLSAMALGKPVIVTAGPQTNGILDDELAVVVPPEDPSALREAMSRLYEDAAWRQRLAERGREYAARCGGEDRLLTSLVDWMFADRDAAIHGRHG